MKSKVKQNYVMKRMLFDNLINSMEEGLVCLEKIAIGLIGSILISLVATGIIYMGYKIIEKIKKDV